MVWAQGSRSQDTDTSADRRSFVSSALPFRLEARFTVIVIGWFDLQKSVEIYFLMFKQKRLKLRMDGKII